MELLLINNLKYTASIYKSENIFECNQDATIVYLVTLKHTGQSLKNQFYLMKATLFHLEKINLNLNAFRQESSLCITFA